jgi:hypothetical protein
MIKSKDKIRFVVLLILSIFVLSEGDGLRALQRKCNPSCFLGQLCGDCCQCIWPNCVWNNCRGLSFLEEEKHQKTEKTPKIIGGQLSIESPEGKVHVVDIEPSDFADIKAKIGEMHINFEIKEKKSSNGLS